MRRRCSGWQTARTMTLPALSISREAASLRHRVSDCLREAIGRGELAPGQRLVERELQARLGISRSLLREALQHLQAEGLVDLVPHKGPVVARPDPATVAQIQALRATLALQAAQAVLRRADERAIAALQTAHRMSSVGIGIDDHREDEAAAEAYAHGARLLGAMVDAGGNAVLAAVWTQLSHRVAFDERVALREPSRRRQWHDGLERLLAALAGRQPAALRAAIAMLVGPPVAQAAARAPRSARARRPRPTAEPASVTAAAAPASARTPPLRRSASAAGRRS